MSYSRLSKLLIISEKERNIFNLLNSLTDKTLIVFDTETTGSRPGKYQHVQITELAAVTVKDLQAIDTYHKFSHLTEATQERIKTEKTDDEIVQKQLEGSHTIEKFLSWSRYDESEESEREDVSEVVSGFKDFVDKHADAILIAHNASFDMEQVNQQLRLDGIKPITNQVIDTYNLAYVLFSTLLIAMEKSEDDKAQQEAQLILTELKDPEKGRLRHNLGVLGKALNVPTGGWHSGIEDTMQLLGIFNSILQLYNQNIILTDSDFFKTLFEERSRAWKERQKYFKSKEYEEKKKSPRRLRKHL